MKIKLLRVTNFMPYFGTQEIKFPTGGDNVCVIYGDNMRGKTSFLNAIRYAFFGKATARHLRDINPIDLINIEAVEAGDWRLNVTIEFMHDGVDFEVRRDLNALPHIAMPRNKEDLKETLFVRKGGVPLSGRDLRFEMNQVLPEGISRFFLFDGELLQEYEDLVRNPSSAAKIKASIEAILGVPALTTGLSEIQSLLASAQIAQAQEMKHSKRLQAQAESQISLQHVIAEMRNAIAVNEKDRIALEHRSEELQVKLESLSQVIDLEKELIQIEGEITTVRSSVSEKRARRCDLLQEGWATLLQPRLNLLYKTLKTDRDALLRAFAERTSLTDEALRLRKGASQGICAFCDHDLSGRHLQAVTARLAEIESRLLGIDDHTEELGLIQGKLDAISRIQVPPLAERVLAVEAEIRSTAVSLSELQRREREVRVKISGFAGTDAEKVRAEREQVRTLLGSLDREISNQRQSLQGEQRKLDQTSRLMSRNPATRSFKSSRLVSVYSSLEDVFEKAVDRLRDKQRDRVQDYASHAFRQLTSEPDYAQLEINQNYGLTILDEKARPVQERSAGAEQIVALALIDGLNKAGRRGGPIVMDTPFGRLDNVHRTNVLRFLPQMAEQVILLVHEGELDRQRDLPTLKASVGAIYRIKRVGSRHSMIVEEGFDN